MTTKQHHRGKARLTSEGEAGRPQGQEQGHEWVHQGSPGRRWNMGEAGARRGCAIRAERVTENLTGATENIRAVL